MNFPESESRPVLAPAGNNKSRPAVDNRKQVSKPHRKLEKPQQQQEEIDEATNKVKKSPSPSPSPSPTLQAPASAAHCFNQKLLKSNLSPNASFSSDASSSDSSHSRASMTGRVRRKSFTPTTIPIRRKQCGSRVEKVVVSDGGDSGSADTKKRCGWVTPNSDPCYAAFHDEEWGVPVHDDKILFELLILSTALAELTWPAILNKRHLFREVFLDFDLIAVSKLNEKKTVSPGSAASTLLSEVKLRAIIENARQMCKIIDEFGSFDKYIWGFVNLKPIVSQFRYPRQVPIKTSKADAISKDLVRRGFRGVGPTVVYSFMQVAGLTNDHLISCFRFHDCIAAADGSDKDSSSLKGKVEEKQPEDSTDLGLARALDDLSLSTE